MQVFQAHQALGVGAGGYATARLRYRNDTLDVRHAHGYVVQTLADLGLVGTALSLALLAAWLAALRAVDRPTHSTAATPMSAVEVTLAVMVGLVPPPAVIGAVHTDCSVPSEAVK